MLESSRELVQRLLQAAIIERVHARALSADKVVMVMGTVGKRGLVASRRSPAEVETLQQADGLQGFEGPIHGRDCDGAALPTELIDELLCGEDALLTGDHLDDRRPRQRGAMAGVAKRALGQLDPLGRPRRSRAGCLIPQGRRAPPSRPC